MWLCGVEPFACRAPPCPEPHRGPAAFLPPTAPGRREASVGGKRALTGGCGAAGLGLCRDAASLSPQALGLGPQLASLGPLSALPRRLPRQEHVPTEAEHGRGVRWMCLVPGGCGLHLPCHSPGPLLHPLGHRAPAGALQGRVHGSLASRGPCDLTPVSLLSSCAVGFMEKQKKKLSSEEMPQISKFTPWQRYLAGHGGPHGGGDQKGQGTQRTAGARPWGGAFVNSRTGLSEEGGGEEKSRSRGGGHSPGAPVGEGHSGDGNDPSPLTRGQA